jgi:hypothetical protein
MVSSTYMPNVYINTANPAAGQIFYRDGQLKIFDGNGWISINTSQSVELRNDDVVVLAWAREKMNEEKRLQELATKHVVVADAMQEVERAKEKLQVVVNLCESPK